MYIHKLKIGNVELENNILLAPMAGITDAPFRDLVLSFGATAVVSEMVSSEALVRSSKKTYRRLQNNSETALKIVQIISKLEAGRTNKKPLYTLTLTNLEVRLMFEQMCFSRFKIEHFPGVQF